MTRFPPLRRGLLAPRTVDSEHLLEARHRPCRWDAEARSHDGSHTGSAASRCRRDRGRCTVELLVTRTPHKSRMSPLVSRAPPSGITPEPHAAHDRDDFSVRLQTVLTELSDESSDFCWNWKREVNTMCGPPYAVRVTVSRLTKGKLTESSAAKIRYKVHTSLLYRVLYIKSYQNAVYILLCRTGKPKPFIGFINS